MNLAVIAALAAAPIPGGIVADPCTPEIIQAMRGQDWRATDWAQLCRYSTDNKQLLANGTPVRVVFMGDSITQGWIDQDPSLFTHGIVDRGISGQTTPQMLVRFRPDVLSLRPQVVHIMAGTNDIAGNTGPTTLDAAESNIRSMAELARAQGIKVIIGSALPADRFDWSPDRRPAPLIAELNARLKRYAAANGFGYADYYAALVNANGGMDPVNAADGVHPTKAGYAVMRPIADGAVAAALSGGRR